MRSTSGLRGRRGIFSASGLYSTYHQVLSGVVGLRGLGIFMHSIVYIWYTSGIVRSCYNEE